METNSFLEVLKRTRAGRVLVDHLAAYAAKASGETHSAQLQTITLFRTLIAGLRGSDSKPVFGLPTTLPRFLLLASLSGERVLLYSQSPELLRILIANTGHPQERQAFVTCFDELVAAADMDSSLSVCMVYVLPWQEGLGSDFWRASTLHPKSLDDSRWILSSNCKRVKGGARNNEFGEFPVGALEVAALQKDLFAVSIEELVSTSDDFDLSTGALSAGQSSTGESTYRLESVDAASNKASNEIRILREALNSALSQRRNVQEELEQTKQRLTKELEDLKHETEIATANTVKATLNTREAYAEKARLAEESARAVIDKAGKQATELSNIKWILRENEAKMKTERSAASKQQKAANAALSSLNGRLKDLESTLEKTRKELQAEKNRQVKDTDDRVQKVMVQLREANDRNAEGNRVIDKLTSAVESRENDISSISHERDALRKQVEELQTRFREEREDRDVKAKLLVEKEVRISVDAARLVELASELDQANASLVEARETASRNLEIAEAAERASTQTARTGEMGTMTSNMSTSTHSVAATQTHHADLQLSVEQWGKAGLLDPAFDGSLPSLLPDTVPEACRQAHRMLLNLIEVSQRTSSSYQADFKGHFQLAPYRPNPKN